jgi:signal transduction histidine kinase
MNGPLEPSKTHFAPAGRADALLLQAEMDACLQNPVTQAILDSLDGYLMVLNEQRQILVANETLTEALAAEGHHDLLGQRWGECMGCVHVPEGPDGCGTSEACSCCGAAISILSAQQEGQKAESECRMALRHNGLWEGREFQVHAHQLALPCGQLVVLVFHDISGQKRREALEATFLHDLANTIQALSAWSSLLSQAGDSLDTARRIVDISGRLSDVVHNQRQLLQAEQGSLVLEAVDLDVPAFLASLAMTLRAHPAWKRQAIEIDATPTDDRPVRTDGTLLFRILLNMGINALEATAHGGMVRLAFQWDGGGPVFSVLNAGEIPKTAALQIFHRSFSTKAKSGRGLDTYAMKILGENHLHGKVGFRTSVESGTTFFIQLPA